MRGEGRRGLGRDGATVHGLEENTMAILDNFGFANSDSSHHLNDDRCAFLEAVRTAFLLPDNGSRPSRKIFDAIFHILRDADSFDLAVESYELLVELDKRFPRVFLSKDEEPNSSSTSRDSLDIVLTEGAWHPFNFGLDSCNEKGNAKNCSKNSLDSLGFHGLLQEIAEVTKNIKCEELQTTSLKLLLLQYLVSVLEGDFWPRNRTYRENMNWTLLRESLLNMLLGSRKINYRMLMKDCVSIMFNLSNWSLVSEKADYLENFVEGMPDDAHGVIFLAFPEMKRSICSFLKKLFIMVMELDSSWKIANDHSLTNRADRLRTPVVEIILDELIYDDGLLSFLQAFDCKQRTEIIVQYFQKYMPKSSVQTRRSNASTSEMNFEGVLKWLCNINSTRSIIRKLSTQTVELLLAYGFQAYLTTLHLPFSEKSSSVADTKKNAVEICRNMVTVFTYLRQEHPSHEIVDRGREALFTAAGILSLN